MAKIRVEEILGNNNVLLVVPHGHPLDDTDTDTIAIQAAQLSGSHAVINCGWKRHANVDALKSLANCNNHKHVTEPVVEDEFLKPIINCVNRNKIEHIVFIHGMSNGIRQQAPGLDVIAGWGKGAKPKYTCTQYFKDLFLFLMQQNKFNVYEGMAGGKYSARDSNNLTQACQRYFWHATQRIQLEFVWELRKNKKEAANLGTRLAAVINDFLSTRNWNTPAGLNFQEI